MERLKFRVNASFWAFLAGAVIFKKGYLACTYTLAVVLHETAHYFVARKLFYRCTEIRLGVFGAVLYGDFADIMGGDRIKVALAGPMCNFILCLACLALWWILPDSYYFTESFFNSNLSMGCVNLLPCYPLDGGRVLTGILDKYTSNALKVTKIFTYIFSSALFSAFVVSLFIGHNLFGVALFAIGLFSGVFNESGGECYKRCAFLPNLRFNRHGMEKKTLVFNGENKLSDVVKRMRGNYFYCLEVVDSDLNVCADYDISQLENLVVTVPLETKLKNLKA